MEDSHRRKRMLELFKEMDFDHSNTVDLEEFHDVGAEVMRLSGSSKPYSKEAASKALAKTFVGVDKNHDRALQKLEIIEWGIRFHPKSVEKFDKKIDLYIEAARLCRVKHAQRRDDAQAESRQAAQAEREALEKAHDQIRKEMEQEHFKALETLRAGHDAA